MGIHFRRLIVELLGVPCAIFGRQSGRNHTHVPLASGQCGSEGGGGHRFGFLVMYYAGGLSSRLYHRTQIQMWYCTVRLE